MSSPDSCSSLAPDKAVHTGLKSQRLNVHIKQPVLSLELHLHCPYKVYKQASFFFQVASLIVSAAFCLITSCFCLLSNRCVVNVPAVWTPLGVAFMCSCKTGREGCRCCISCCVVGRLLYFWVYQECFISALLFRWVLKSSSHEPVNKWRRNRCLSWHSQMKSAFLTTPTPACRCLHHWVSVFFLVLINSQKWHICSH